MHALWMRDLSSWGTWHLLKASYSDRLNLSVLWNLAFLGSAQQALMRHVWPCAGARADVPLTPDQGEPGKRRATGSTTTASGSSGNSRRNSESAEGTSEGGWPSSSSGGWPSSSSSVDVQAYRAALR